MMNYGHEGSNNKYARVRGRTWAWTWNKYWRGRSATRSTRSKRDNIFAEMEKWLKMNSYYHHSLLFVIVGIASIIMLSSFVISTVIAQNNSSSTSRDHSYYTGPIADPNDPTHVKAQQQSAKDRWVSSVCVTKVMVIHHAIMWATIQVLQKLSLRILIITIGLE